MRVLLSVFVAILLLATPSRASADPVKFSLTGTLADGGTLSGALVVSEGYFNPTDIVVRDGGVSYPFQGDFFEGENTSGGMPYQLYSVSYQEDAELLLAFPIPVLTGFDGGPLCSATVDCAPKFTSSFSPMEGGPAIEFVTLTASATPEPESWILLGTGVLTLAGSRPWRRLATRVR